MIEIQSPGLAQVGLQGRKSDEQSVWMCFVLIAPSVLSLLILSSSLLSSHRSFCPLMVGSLLSSLLLSSHHCYRLLIVGSVLSSLLLSLLLSSSMFLSSSLLLSSHHCFCPLIASSVLSSLLLSSHHWFCPLIAASVMIAASVLSWLYDGAFSLLWFSPLLLRGRVSLQRTCSNLSFSSSWVLLAAELSAAST